MARSGERRDPQIRIPDSEMKLDSLERTLERALERCFRGLGGRLQPVEIAQRLAREMEAGRTLSVGGVYAPNHFLVHLAPADAERLLPFAGALAPELENYLAGRAASFGLRLPGKPQVSFDSDPALPAGEMLVESRMVAPEGPADQGAMLVVASGPASGQQVPLGGQPLWIGRSPDCALQLNDPRISRRHAQIRREEGYHLLEDLDSKNGTLVNQDRITSRRLEPGDTIQLGGTLLRYQLS